jgi:riboflavin transporter FmnP
MKKILNTKNMLMISLLSAISAILMCLEISVPFMPVFIKMDLAEIPVMIGGLMFGFYGGVIIAVLKIIIKLLFIGSSTAFIGEIVNLICSILYILPCLVYYHYKKDLKIGLLLCTVICAISVVVINYYVTFPMYCNLFGFTIESIIEMFKMLNPYVKDTLTMMLFSLIPFNLIKYGINSILVYLIYKRLPIRR